MADEPLGDIPLFREIQKLLASGNGPINFELARQIAVGVAQPAPQWEASPRDVQAYAAVVREAETMLASYTRLDLPEPFGLEVVGRRGWIEITLSDWEWLLVRFADRFGSATGVQEQAAVGAALSQVSPLLLGIQAGTLVGGLATRALGRYDYPIPRSGDDLIFVAPNVDDVGRGFEFGDDWRRLLAFRETAPHLVVSSTPWVSPYWKSLLVEVVDSLEIDLSDIERRLEGLGAQAPGAMGDDLPNQIQLPLVANERHDRAVERLRAFFGVLEGYCGHSVGEVAGVVVPDEDRYSEALLRHRVAESQAESLLAGVLGLEGTRRLVQIGTTFCNAVVSLRGLSTLNLVWAAPDNLPTTAELKDPFTWLDRVGPEDASPPASDGDDLGLD